MTARASCFPPRNLTDRLEHSWRSTSNVELLSALSLVSAIGQSLPRPGVTPGLRFNHCAKSSTATVLAMSSPGTRPRERSEWLPEGSKRREKARPAPQNDSRRTPQNCKDAVSAIRCFGGSVLLTSQPRVTEPSAGLLKRRID